MSVLLGSWHYDGRALDLARAKELGAPTHRYAPDAESYLVSGPLCFGCQLLSTHDRDWSSREPYTDAQGNMAVFAGRLDNHQELAGLFGLRSATTPDVHLVLEAYRRWDEDSFTQFIGDWSLVLWCARRRNLFLARDHAGTQSLFYQMRSASLVWSTYLETFLADGVPPELNREYAARYLACAPTESLTPYADIWEVPPGAYVRLDHGVTQINQHWTPVTDDRIRYRTDAEYEQHFFHLFRQAVQRRTENAATIITELSGGMDSSAIVCMDDYARRERLGSDAPLLDTLSYFDEGEPNWNEKPFFTAVEEARGKRGIHIATSYLRRDFSNPDPAYPLPGIDGSAVSRERAFENCFGGFEKRVVVSGFGGDELLGGASNPVPVLADALMEGRFGSLREGLIRWSVAERITVWQMLSEVVHAAYGQRWSKRLSQAALPPWLRLSDSIPVRSNDARMREVAGTLPSTRDSVASWNSVIETLPHRLPGLLTRREYRYPILDRDLVEFLLRVPSDQLRRPGERRSLMRRALGSLIPREVMQRTRKAFLQRGPIRLLDENRHAICSLFLSSALGDLGLVDPNCIQTMVQRDGIETLAQHRKTLMRAIHLELWLRGRLTPETNLLQEPHESAYAEQSSVSA
jgi:asparagine synthase (glutamine-hydrolysing)